MRYSLDPHRLIWTQHFSRRLSERDIGWAEVVALLADAYVRRLPDNRAELTHPGSNVAVVIGERVGPAALVTVYRIRNAARPQREGRARR